MERRIRLILSTAFLAVLATIGVTGIIGMANVATASLQRSISSQPVGTASGSSAGKQGQYSDDFDSLKPAGMKGLSYSVLVNSGRVHVHIPSRSPGSWTNPFAPLLNIAWGSDMLTGSDQGEPAAGINQSNPIYALISGNFSIDHTTNGGTTWTSLGSPPNPHGYGDVVNAWLTDNPNHALEIALNPSGDGADMTCAQSTDFGVTWTTFSSCSAGVDTTFFDDREYIWVDNFASSPFHGRIYVTEALFDSLGSGNFNTVTNRWSSDNGATWNPPSSQPIALVPNTEFQQRLDHNEYPSLGISPDGTLGYIWHRGQCCNTITGVPNRVMFARSTDGGATFPFSTTIVTVPVNQSVMFNSNSPFGQRWSDTPNIAADPTTNGTFYALWTQYRTPNSAASAAIYLSRTTDNGANWSTPVIPYNNPNAGIFQGFGWVKVTADHAVHVTFLGGTTSNMVAAQFYVQSTDGGATWSAPLQLSATTLSAFASTTDYIADDVTLAGGQGAILAGIEEDNGHHARIGTFDSTPTPTVTGTPPTITPTFTSTNTPTVTPTVCGVSNPYSYATATGSIVPGVDDTGNHCDDCLTTISLPFAYTLYDQTFTSASVGSNGTLQFVSFGSFLRNTCLPSGGFTYTLFPYWDDLTTANSGFGIFTSVSGTAPNRIFNIEWRAQYYPVDGSANFEVRLYEGQKRFDIIYATLTGDGTIATIGAQLDSSNYTQFTCSTGTLSHDFMLTFTQPSCGTPNTATATPTNSPTLTPDPCAIAWSVVPSPNGDLTNNLLAGVAAIANNDVWAVGNDVGPGASMQTLVEHWDGSAWTIVPSPNLGTNGSGLTSVAAITSNDVWAVGQFSTGTVPHTLTEHWDGSAWTVVPSPDLGTAGNVLNAVTDVAANDVWAVGYAEGSGFTAYETLVEHWDGSAWSVVPSVDPDTLSNLLYGVSAVAANDVWVVGEYYNTALGRNQTLVEHWDGSAWTIVPSPNVGTEHSFLYAVSAIGADDVWAVGDSVPTNSAFQSTLVEHWDGSAWTIVPSPNSGTLTNSLLGVTARSHDDVWAAGTAYDGNLNQTLIEHWDGSAWSVVPSPNVGPSHNYLYAVSVPHNEAGGTVWAVGQYFDSSSGYRTLVERAVQPCTATPLPTFTTLPSSTALASGTPIRTATSAPTTATATNTSVAPTNTSVAPTTTSTSPTGTPGAATETPTACTVSFEDVPVGSTFYPYIHCLVCLGIINGYPDGTFRPNANVTRGQLSKIVSNSAGFSDSPTGQQFQDVPPSGPGSTFYAYIYRLVHRGYINGYECGAPSVGPCMPPDNLPYFLPNAPATRGQISKIVSNAAGFNESPSGQQFQDVTPNSTFYAYIYRLSSRGIINGYPCGGPGEPCVPPANLPYFRPNANATRGQMSKIDAAAFFPNCNIPSR